MFAVTPERVGIAEGARAALAMAPMAVAAALFHRPELDIGAVAAFWNCLCDPQGTREARLKTMGQFTALGTLVMPLAAYGAHWGYAASLVTLFFLVFLCGLTRSYAFTLGPIPTPAGLIAALAVVIGVASARPLDGAIMLGGFFLLGSVWAIMLCIVIWPITLRRSASLTAAAVYGRLEDMTGFLDELASRPDVDERGWAQFDTVYRRGARMSIERGRALALHDASHDRPLGPRIDAAGRVLSALIAMGHARRNAPKAIGDASRHLLQGLRQLLRDIAAEAQREQLVSATVIARANSLLREASSGEDQTARAVAFAARAVRQLADRERAPSAEPAAAPAVAARGGHWPAPMVWRHALRVAVAGVLAYAIGTWLNVTFAYWGALAAIIVTQPVSANTWLRIVERACGSFLGGLIAAALLTYLSGAVAITAFILPLAAAAIAARLISYGLFVVFLTPMFMLVSNFIHPTQGLIAARLANECIGACLGVAASFLLWPERDSNALAEALAGAVKANMQFASAALRMNGGATAELDRLQREAGLASTRLETARERMLLEGRWRSAQLNRLREVIVALRSICGAAAVIEVLCVGEADSTQRQRADRYDAMTTGLLAALAAPQAGSPAQPASLPADDLELAVQGFAAAFDAYLTGMPAARDPGMGRPS